MMNDKIQCKYNAITVLVMHQNFDFDVGHFIEHKLMQPKSLRTSFLETNSGSMTG